MAAPDYRTSTTALVNALKTLFENRTCTEAQAIAYASTKPNTVFYTSDTHNIVVGGIVYGRSEQITANAFAYLPASELDPSDPAFSDTTKIYIQPTSTAGVMKLWWYYNGQWINSDSQAMSVPISAEDITYDLTNTPDLGEGDVQSAIEALYGKVGDVDQRIDDEKAEFIKDRFPSQNVSNYSRTNVNYKVEIVNGVVTYISNSSYITGFYSKPIHKGSLCNLNLYYSSASSGWGGLSFWGYSTQNPVDYIASHGNIVGLPTTPIKISYKAGVWIRDLWYMMPEDGYLICSYQKTYGPTFGSGCYIYDSMSFKDWYNKGLADGSAMASIVGLGYNVWNYITGAVSMAGFEYGCEIRRKYDKTPVANMQNAYKNNTSVVYFPKTDFSGCTTLSGAFYGANKLLIFPSIDVGTKSFTCLQCFQDCTSLQYVGNFTGLTITNAEYMFENCQALRRVGKLKFSASCSMANTFNVVAPNLTRIEEIDVSAGTLLRYSSYNWNSGAKAKLRYIFIRGFGGNSGQGTLKVDVNWPLWGIADTENPDARQSLVDTLLTYSFDRATAGYSACTVTLSAATKALLTDEEKEQITAKGYTIA